MAYLVRKLNKRESVDKFGEADCIETMPADAATCEFRTTDGRLSTWRIESLDDIGQAVLAIVVTSSKVERMDFIVIDTDFLDERGLVYNQTYAGQEIAVPDLQDTHYDIEGITIRRLLDCSYVYQKVYGIDKQTETYIVRYVEGEIKDLLCEAKDANRIDMSKTNKAVRKLLSVS